MVLNAGIPVRSSLDNVYTVKEAAKLLKVHVNSIYQLVEQKKIRAVRVGKKILISHKALNDFING
jgi:excisionase family DNA binding protein